VTYRLLTHLKVVPYDIAYIALFFSQFAQGSLSHRYGAMSFAAGTRFLIHFFPLQTLGGSGGPSAGGGEDGDESWDEEDEGSSYRDDDSSSDGDDEAEEVLTSRVVPPVPGPSGLPQVHQGSAGASAKRSKELDWDHSCM
jgi:hypothetical protein